MSPIVVSPVVPGDIRRWGVGFLGRPPVTPGMVRSRRRLLAGAGAVLAGATAGCVGDGDDGRPGNVSSMAPDPERYGVEVDTVSRSPSGETRRFVDARHEDDPDATPRRLDELEPAMRRETAIAVTRRSYHGVGDGRFAVESWPVPRVVRYADATFAIRVPVGHRSGGDREASERTLELDASLRGGDLRLAVRNVAEHAVEVRHEGRPSLGVLLGWDGRAHTLGHEAYARNEAIVVGDGVAYPAPLEAVRALRATRRVDPGEGIEETYVVPRGIDEAAEVYLDVVVRRAWEGRDPRERPRFHRTAWSLRV